MDKRSLEHATSNAGDLEREKKSNVPTYALIRMADIPEDTKQDIIDLVTGMLERYIPDVTICSRQVKERMDRLYGYGWHVIIGEHFAFDVTYLAHHLLYLFFGGNLGVLLWKCA